jgi:hypothetical protein
MDLLLKEDKRILLLPALFAFILSFLLLYKYSFPISWDVYYHIHMIDLYNQNGLIFWDYATVAPKGRLIMYPPLFHLCFSFISKLLNITPVELCRLVQPVFSFYLIGIITYVSYKLTDIKTGVLTGFLIMFCFVTFNRSVICTPATVAIGLFLLSSLFIYKAVTENSMKYLIFSALSLALIWNLHMATAILTCGVVGLYSLVQIFNRQMNLKFVIVYILIVLLLGMPWWIYIVLNYSLFFNSLAGNNLLISGFFFRYYGIICSLLLIIGYYILILEKSEKSVFLIIWSIPLLLLSQLGLLGFNIVSIRILEVASYSLIVISGIALSYIYNQYLRGARIKNIFCILFILLSITTCLLYVDSYTPDILGKDDYNTTLIDSEGHMLINPITSRFKPTVISSRFANSSLSHDRYDIMQWFIRENSSDIVVSEDAIMDTIIVSSSRTPVVYGGFTESIPEYVTDPVHIVRGWSNREELSKLNVGYLLLKQDTPIPYYGELAYENGEYKICKIKSEYR